MVQGLAKAKPGHLLLWPLPAELQALWVAWLVMLWIFDHGADWADRIGDLLARPWRRLSQWCYRHWLAIREERQ